MRAWCLHTHHTEPQHTEKPRAQLHASYLCSPSVCVCVCVCVCVSHNYMLHMCFDGELLCELEGVGSSVQDRRAARSESNKDVTAVRAVRWRTSTVKMSAWPAEPQWITPYPFQRNQWAYRAGRTPGRVYNKVSVDYEKTIDEDFQGSKKMPHSARNPTEAIMIRTYMALHITARRCVRVCVCVCVSLSLPASLSAN